MEEISEGKKSQNIWLTARARMEAEKRLKLYDVISHLVLIWYSLWLLCLTVFSASFQLYVDDIRIDELATFLSASVLVLSVANWGFKFGTKAALHRDCYLELEGLLAGDMSNLQSNYAEIKKRFPNHSTFDFDAVLFRRKIINREKIENNDGPVKFSCFAAALYCATWILEKLVFFIAFILPIAGAYILYAF